MTASASRTAVRPSWDTLPPAVRQRITTLAGSEVTVAVTQSGGFTPGLAARLELVSGSRLFVKAVPADHATAPAYQREADTALRIPRDVAAPRLCWTDKASGWIVLAYDDIDGSHPDLTPPAVELPLVLTAVTEAHVPVTGLPQLPEQRAGWLHGWDEIARSGDTTGVDPWAVPRLRILADAETRWAGHAAGEYLVHGDLRADNMISAPGRGVLLVDWAHATIGAPWTDYADLAVQLILAGHHPGEAELIMAAEPAWRAAPSGAVTSYLIALAGYWARSSRLPAPPSVPALRPYQARAASAGLRLVAWRTGQPADV